MRKILVYVFVVCINLCLCSYGYPSLYDFDTRLQEQELMQQQRRMESDQLFRDTQQRFYQNQMLEMQRQQQEYQKQLLEMQRRQMLQMQQMQNNYRNYY